MFPPFENERHQMTVLLEIDEMIEAKFKKYLGYSH